MRERLKELREDVIELKHRAAQAGDCYGAFVWKLLADIIETVLLAGVC